MAKAEAPREVSRMSDEAVRGGTGKSWPEWFHILDAAGAMAMTHREIVAYLREQHSVGPWWQQMVTVSYEQARGLREKHQKPSGYQVSASRTLTVPLPTLWAAWADETSRMRWLPEPITIRRATPERSLRATWSDGRGSLDVDFYGKGEAKSQVTVQHGKLTDGADAAAKKAYWAERLDRLRALLEP